MASPCARASWMIPRDTIVRDELHLLVRAPRGAPPGGTLVRVEDLEIPLVGAKHAYDEAQGRVEERLGMLSIAETEQTDV